MKSIDELKNVNTNTIPKVFQYLYKLFFCIFALYAFGKTFIIKYPDRNRNMIPVIIVYSSNT